MSAQNNHQNNSHGHRLPLNHCKKVFVQRDYAQGLPVKFYSRIPQELQGRIDEYQFERTVNEMNRLYTEGEKVGARSAMETLLGCFTCYLSHLCLTHQYDKLEISLLTEPANSRPQSSQAQ